MDYNHSTDRALCIEDVKLKFESFGWNTYEVDGHNLIELSMIKKMLNKPTFVLCNTIKGKGIQIMENSPEWHHKTPDTNQYNLIIDELKK